MQDSNKGNGEEIVGLGIHGPMVEVDRDSGIADGACIEACLPRIGISVVWDRARCSVCENGKCYKR